MLFYNGYLNSDFNKASFTYSKIRVVFIFKIFGEEEEYRLSKEDQKEIKIYCKDKKINLSTLEESMSELKRKQADIFEPLFQAGGTLEQKQNKAKEQMLSIPEIARHTTFVFYKTNGDTPDSTRIIVSSFPLNTKKNITYSATIKHPQNYSLIECIKMSIDSCVSKKYFE
jgi:hypothetical protein